MQIIRTWQAGRLSAINLPTWCGPLCAARPLPRHTGRQRKKDRQFENVKKGGVFAKIGNLCMAHTQHPRAPKFQDLLLSPIPFFPHQVQLDHPTRKKNSWEWLQHLLQPKTDPGMPQDSHTTTLGMSICHLSITKTLLCMHTTAFQVACKHSSRINQHSAPILERSRNPLPVPHTAGKPNQISNKHR